MKYFYSSLLIFLLWCMPVHADVYRITPGARSLAMGGAHRGLGTSNDTLWLNPAGLAVMRRFSVDAQYAYGNGDRLSHVKLSALDSKSGPVAGAVGYIRDWGNESDVNPALNRIAGALAYAIVPSLALGAMVDNIRGDFNQDGVRQSVDMYNATAGMSLLLGEHIGLGAAYQNILHIDNRALEPRMLGLGAALYDSFFTLTCDVDLDVHDERIRATTWRAGGELFVFDVAWVRLGGHYGPGDPALQGPDAWYVSGGIGIISGTGGVLASAERLVHANEWTFITGMELFF